MKKFTHIESGLHSLHHDDCVWLTNMGLRETRWILDVDWISYSYDITYKQWMRMGG